MIDLRKLQQELRERDLRLRQAIARWRRYRIKYRTVEALKLRRSTAFAAFTFPIIQNMRDMDLVEQLVAVQPMAQPGPGAFYLDIRMGNRTMRRHREAQRRRNERRGRLGRWFLRAGQFENVYENELNEFEAQAAGRAQNQFEALLYGALVRPPEQPVHLAAA